MALTDEQLELFGGQLAALYQDFERAVIGDIARRLAKTGRLTETAELMAETLREQGWSPARIYTQVMRALSANEYWEKEIAANTLAIKQKVRQGIDALNAQAGKAAREIAKETGVLAFRTDLEAWKMDRLPIRDSAFERLVEAMRKDLTGELLNLTKTTAFRLNTGDIVPTGQIYARELNNALVKVSSGAYSYGKAIGEAVNELAKSGIRTVDYAKGAAWQLDTAVRNAVMTASAQLAGRITMHNVEQTGVEHVEVSSHLGARTGEGHANHAGWQGQVYRVQGSDAQYRNLEEATGYPTDPAGLCGYNCRHNIYPFWPGVSERIPAEPEPAPVEYNGRRYTYYQATQEQRRREREIRALKREANARKDAGLDDKQLRARIKAKTVEYDEFSGAVGIRAKNERLRVGNMVRFS